MTLPIGLAPAPHDRLGERRADAAWIAARLADPSTRLVPLWDVQVLVGRADGRDADADDAPSLEPVLVGAAALDALRAADALDDADAEALVLLGERDGTTYFAVALRATDADSALDVVSAAARAHGEPVPHGAAWSELRAALGGLAPDAAALLAQARALRWWHRRHRFCPVCGALTASRDAGHVRACTNGACGAQQFPRTDPAVIALVTHRHPTLGERCLLGSQVTWPPELYSLLAGFVEPGESAEDAVRREVREEAGVTVHAVRYRASQPWPFPASLMLGFTADAATDALAPDGTELRDARWFTRDELRAESAAGTLRLPSAMSIARFLLDEWLAAAPHATTSAA